MGRPEKIAITAGIVFRRRSNFLIYFFAYSFLISDHSSSPHDYNILQLYFCDYGYNYYMFKIANGHKLVITNMILNKLTDATLRIIIS